MYFIFKMGITRSKFMSTTLPRCTLWKADRSPACRSVMMALDAMDISITEVDVDMDKAEHRIATIAIMNPLKTLPILKDKELILCDSHAIGLYLATRYCKDKFLPKDPAGRAQIDQLLHYNSGVLQPIYRAAAYPIIYENCRYVTPQHTSCIENVYQNLEAMLAGRKWFNGSGLSLADIVIAASISSLNILVPVDKLRFKGLSSWLFRMSEQPFYITANAKGLIDFAKRIDTGLSSNVTEFKNCPQTSSTRRSGGKLSEK